MLIGFILFLWGGMEAWWAAVREPAEPIGVTELLEALWWLPGPEEALEARQIEPPSTAPIEVDGLDSAGWVGLGLSPRQAASAMRYRSAVGGFRDSEVLRRMRVLPDVWMERHGSRVVFPQEGSILEGERNRLAGVKPESCKSGSETSGERRARPVVPVDLNSADSLTLLDVHGVGPWVAGKILDARKRWGGFADTSLLVEALGWDSLARAIMPRFTCGPETVRLRCPDSLSVEDWESLPGIGRREAATIARFVGHHGGSAEVLKSCCVLDSTRWSRVLPYLECGGEEHP